MSAAVGSPPADADNRMLQRRDSMAADERAKNVSNLPYDESIGKLNKFYRQGNSPNFTHGCLRQLEEKRPKSTKTCSWLGSFRGLTKRVSVIVSTDPY